VEYEHVSYGFSVTVPLGDLVARVWEQELRESPAFDREAVLDLFGGPQRSYRERLDRQHRNHYGDLIPRIVTVRRNLRALGKPVRPPRLPA
jgi:hypothetical protein